MNKGSVMSVVAADHVAAALRAADIPEERRGAAGSFWCDGPRFRSCGDAFEED